MPGPVGDAVFREVHRRIIERMDDGGLPRWCGWWLYAVDGTKINLPCELVERGYRTPQPEAHYPQELVSCLCRLNDRCRSTSTWRRMVAAHLPHVHTGDVVVYDRGYTRSSCWTRMSAGASTACSACRTAAPGSSGALPQAERRNDSCRRFPDARPDAAGSRRIRAGRRYRST